MKPSHGVPRAARVRNVWVTDQLGTSTLDVLRPRYPCAPASKHGEDPAAPTHAHHLVGYEVRHLGRFGTLEPFLTEQFGSLAVTLIRREALCVPALTGR